MPILVRCPNPACAAHCSVAEADAGRPVKCVKCGKGFTTRPTIDGQQADTGKGRPATRDDPFPLLPAEFGRYRVLRLLGRGGMGAVYLAQDSQLGRQVALKIPFFDAAESPQRVERFVREAQSAAMLQHPNICTVFDAGQIDGRPFITMAYIAGTSLDILLDSGVPVPQPRAAEIARKVALALGHAHGKGTVHRDLKPANVMIAEDGEPVVMDFGLAKRVTEVDKREAKLTRLGGVGTPAYMSPEQVRGDGPAIGPPTDIYSLGVMLFEMLAGRTPYSGSLGVVMGQILSAPVPPIREFRPDADARLEAICHRAMAKEPAARFRGMAEFADALERWRKAPVASPPPLPPAPAPETARASAATIDPSPFACLEDEPIPAPRRRKGRGGVVALALAVLLPLGVWLATGARRAEAPNGTLIVEVNDEEVESRIKGRRLILSGPDGGVRYTLAAGERNAKLETGLYKIRVEGADGLAPTPAEFTLKEDGEVRVRVMMARKPEVPKDAPPAPSVPVAGDMITNSVGMNLVPIPPGKFLMGSPQGEGRDDERPEHEVEITKAFYLGVHEVTQKQFRDVMGYNPSYFARGSAGKQGKAYGTRPGDGRNELGADDDPDEFPVENVSWEEAKEFCEKLSSLGKEREKRHGYRLPTEAEWEYACRGGAVSKTRFHTGNTRTSSHANFGDEFKRTRKVGSYQPNGFGLHDMHGNVHEWCWDRYGAGYYAGGAAIDPQGPSEGPKRVIRGGGWNYPVELSSSGVRHPYEPTFLNNNLGFRVAMMRVSESAETVTSQPAKNPDVHPDADRKAAEYVLSIGGKIRIDDQDRDREAVAELPPEAFRLTYVHLAHNTRATDAGMAAFEGCKHLTVLSLHVTNVGDMGLAHFKDCKNLTELWLRRTRVTDAGLAHFSGCRSLTRLDLGFTRIGDAGLACFKGCTKLTALHLGGTQVRGAGLAAFKDCASLTELALNDSQVVDAGLTPCGECRSLQAIRLHGTKVTVAGIDGLKKALPNCTIGWDKSPAGGPDRKGADKAAKPDESRVFLCDLKETAWVAHRGKFGIKGELNVAGITVNGEKFPKGLWTHPRDKSDASVKYNLEGLDALLFSTKVAINDTARKGCKTPLNFQVLGDGKTLWTSRSVKSPGQGDICSIKVRGVRVLELRVVCAGNHGSAHAVWLNPSIVPLKKAKADPKPANADRKAAVYVLSIGGTVRVNHQDRDITAAADLPREPFRLTDIDLGDNKRVTDEGLAKFKNCEDLVGLSLISSGVTNIGLAHLKGCTNLDHLRLSNTRVSDAGLPHLEGFRKLTFLGLQKTELTGAGIGRLRKALPNCKVLVD